MSELRLIALDTEDLAVVSAQLQDAVLRVGDLAYLPNDRRFVAIANRFDWLGAAAGSRDEPSRDVATKSTVLRHPLRKSKFERRRTALRFEHVKHARLQGIALSDKRRVLSLLAVSFVQPDADQPDGTITLAFSGDAAIALDVECIECELRDLGAAWATRSRPHHDLPPDDDVGASDETNS
ncbi:MAG: DUF2948 family protein [Pseudomonadota bacterium]